VLVCADHADQVWKELAELRSISGVPLPVPDEGDGHRPAPLEVEP
jgi:hypothetical protein